MKTWGKVMSIAIVWGCTCAIVVESDVAEMGFTTIPAIITTMFILLMGSGYLE